MKAQLEQKLAELKGKQITDAKGNIVSINYKFGRGNYLVIFTDERPRNFSYHEALEYLNTLSVSEVSISQIESHNATPIKQTHVEHIALHTQLKQESKTLKEALLFALNKVKEDKQYLDQAKATCDIASQFVNIQKNEIRIAEILHK